MMFKHITMTPENDMKWASLHPTLGEYKFDRADKIASDTYIEKAFEYAHRADPGAELYYNDFPIFRRTDYWFLTVK
ncbi:MAG: endo-1,4-beta-xylanase [Desulfobacteraceae bacterium]|jgi:GH35 family endo-1,4-beta-xylanase